MAKRSDVVLARVFFSDSPESKLRPCIVLSDENYHNTGFVLLSPITTADDEYCIHIEKKDVDCELSSDSGAHFDMIVKSPGEQIVKKMGKVTPMFYDKLVARIIGTIKSK